MEKKEMQVIGKMDFYGIELDIYGDLVTPWFKALDVAKCIDYSKTSQGYYNVSKMVMGIKDSEKTTITIGNSGDNYTTQTVFITEFGLYCILFKSRLPKAEEFNEKVMQTLKTIRLTGGYIHNTQQFVSHYFPDVTDTQELIEKLEERIKFEDTINRLSIQRAEKYLQDRKDSWKVQNEYKDKIDFLEDLIEILTKTIKDSGYEYSREVKKQLARGEMLGYTKENTHE